MSSAKCIHLAGRNRRRDSPQKAVFLYNLNEGVTFVTFVGFYHCTKWCAKCPRPTRAEHRRHRPDLAQAERTLAASDATIGAARAQFLPSLRLNGTGGAALSTALANPIRLWSVGASILAPIFEGGRLRANVDAATARRDQAAFAYQRTALQAFREADDALVSIDRLGVQRQRLDAQRAAAREVLRHATNRYRAGYSPYLEQLDAQRGLLSVDLSRVQLRTDELNARVSLYQALGGGWDRP